MNKNDSGHAQGEEKRRVDLILQRYFYRPILNKSKLREEPFALFFPFLLSLSLTARTTFQWIDYIRLSTSTSHHHHHRRRHPLALIGVSLF